MSLVCGNGLELAHICSMSGNQNTMTGRAAAATAADSAPARAGRQEGGEMTTAKSKTEYINEKIAAHKAAARKEMKAGNITAAHALEGWAKFYMDQLTFLK